jgi:hypothetical protein
MFANTEFIHLEVFFGAFHGKHELKFKINSEEERKDISYGGVKAFAFCDGIAHGLESLLRTVTAFAGGFSTHPDLPVIGSHTPPYMENANHEFLKESMGYDMETRAVQKVEIDTDLIQSGDYFAVMRMDGLDQIIMYGTGSHSGHSVMAMRFDGELHIIES